jgi:hypothetical protein
LEAPFPIFQISYFIDRTKTKFDEAVFRNEISRLKNLVAEKTARNKFTTEEKREMPILFHTGKKLVAEVVKWRKTAFPIFF